MNKFFKIRNILLVYLSSFTGYLRVTNFSSSNPIFFLISLIFSTTKFNKKIIDKYTVMFLIASLGSIVSLANGNSSLDQRFLMIITTVYLQLFLIENSAFNSINIDKKLLQKLYRYAAYMFLILFASTFSLNLFNFHCIFFKCREFSKGMTFMTVEPSYVGLISIAFFSLSLLLDTKNNKRLKNILLVTSVLATMLSRSILSLGVVIFLIGFSLIPYLKRTIYQLVVRLKLFQKTITTLFFIFFSIFIFNYIDTGSSVLNEFTKILTETEKGNLISLNNFRLIAQASGVRLAFFFASISSQSLNFFTGHGIFSSSSIFYDNILQIIENFNLGKSQETLLEILGRNSKPHTLFGFIFFTNGLFGLFFLFKREFINLGKVLFRIFDMSDSSNNGNQFKKYWFRILPLVILLYPSTNTDPFKFLCLYLYYFYLYGEFVNE